MIKKNYNNYLIESKGFKSVDNSYVREALFEVKSKDKNILFTFMVGGIEFDTKATENNNPEKFFLDLCLEKIKDCINEEKDLKNKIFEKQGSIFIKKNN